MGEKKILTMEWVWPVSALMSLHSALKKIGIVSFPPKAIGPWHMWFILPGMVSPLLTPGQCNISYSSLPYQFYYFLGEAFLDLSDWIRLL